MTSSVSNIKTLCEEFLNNSNSEEQLNKSLNKFLNILKISDKTQKDLFIHLSDRGLNKLLASLKENNIDIRKNACRVLIELLNNNEVLQNIFCEKFNFNPIGNVICFNWLPRSLKENLKIDEKVILEIKNSANSIGKGKYWMWPINLKYDNENIPDPQKYLLGFYYANKNSLYNINIDDNIERLDTYTLTCKLEEEIIEESKVSTPKGIDLGKEHLEKYIVTEPLNLQTEKKVNDNQLKIDRNIGKKIKEEYKKNIKEKNYSRSIDTNIPKPKPGVNNTSNDGKIKVNHIKNTIKK